MNARSRWLALLCLLIFGLPGFARSDNAEAAVRHRLNISPQPMAEALRAFANQTNLQIVYYTDLAAGESSNGVVGNLNAADALRSILGETGLTFQFLNDRTVAIQNARDAARAKKQVAPNEPNVWPLAQQESNSLHLAQTQAGAAPATGGSSNDSNDTRSSNAADSSTGARAPREVTLEEVVVSARRREENLQQIPISIAALSADVMAVHNMQSIKDVLAVTPNTFVTSALAGGTNFSMRGIPRVGFFEDGIWQQNAALLDRRSVLELDHIEILRGPQGTLYGRDSTGGAIKTYTKLPSKDFGVRAVATLGSYNRRDISLNADLPVTSTFFTKWTFSTEERDGYVRSLSINRHYGEIDSRLIRGDLLWVPNDRVSVRLTGADIFQGTTDASITTYLIPPLVPLGTGNDLGFIVSPRHFYLVAGFPYDNEHYAAGYPGGQVGEFETKSKLDPGQHGNFVDAQTLTLTVKARLTDSINFTSLSGGRRQYDSGVADFGQSNFQFYTASNMNKSHMWSQEFQFSGDHGRFNWVAGLYGFEFVNDNRAFRWALLDLNLPAIFASPQCQAYTPAFAAQGIARCSAAIPNNTTFNGSSAKGDAVFGEGNLKLFDKLTLTLGGRYHDQSNELWTNVFGASTVTRAQAVIPGQLLGGEDRYFDSLGRINRVPTSFQQATYRAALSYQITPDAMVYGGYSEGFDAGGVTRVSVTNLSNQQVLIDVPYNPEKVANYEIGLRSDWLDNRLRVNVTAFYTTWTDLQFSAQIRNPFTGNLVPASTVQNVAEAVAKGTEWTIAAQPTDHLSFDIGVGTLDTEYTKIAPGTVGVTLNSAFANAPKLQYNLGAQWVGNGPRDGEITVRADYNWTDGYNRNATPLQQASANIPSVKYDQEAFGLLNFRAGYKSQDDKWELAVFGTNLGNKQYLAGGFNPAILALDFGIAGRPREYGATLKFSF